MVAMNTSNKILKVNKIQQIMFFKQEQTKNRTNWKYNKMKPKLIMIFSLN